jgi:hypothetical protein
MNDTQSLSLHPEILRLTEENSLLREEVVHLLTEAHDLVHTVKPNLLALYQTKIGVWELKQFRLQCQAARLKRKVELIQACLNQGCWPDLVAIEAQLEEEFRAWENKLRLEAERIAAAEDRLRHLLSPEDDHELKKLYYGLVKKLHPDLNPELTEDQKRLWLRVQEAYELSDIDELRALTVLVNRYAPVVSPASSLERLTNEQRTLDQQIQRLLKEIEAIESRPPLTMRSELVDDDWMRTRCETIQTTMTELQQRCVGLASHIENLLKEYPGEQSFGKN